MGSDKSKPKSGKASNSANTGPFSEKEAQILRTLYCQLSAEADFTKANLQSPDQLKDFLKLDGKSVFDWLKQMRGVTNSDPKKPPRSQVPFECFAAGIEILTQVKSNYIYTPYNSKRYPSVQLLCALMFQAEQWTQLDFETFMLTKANCAAVIEYIFMAFGVNPEKITGRIMENIFKHVESDTISIEKFLIRVSENLQYANRYLLEYWKQSIFVKINQPLTYTNLMEPSEILTDDLLPLLYMNNPAIQQAKGLYLLYSSNKSGISFNRLAFAILGYNAPTMIVIKHKEVNKDTNEATTHIVGAYYNEQWYSSLKYQGDSQSYLFSISPKYQTITSQDGMGQSNYAFMNNRHIERSKFKVGLGFGGNEELNSFRFWIDDDIQSSSYIRSEDKTFGRGGNMINSSSVVKLDVRCLEIWGIGGEENLEAQLEHRENERKEIERIRKVDKKALWGDGFNQQVLFGKLNAHREQMHQEVEKRGEENN